MAKSGLINPATGRDYLVCELDRLSPGEKQAATIHTLDQLKAPVLRELRSISEELRSLKASVVDARLELERKIL